MTHFHIIYGLNSNNYDGGVELMPSIKIRLRTIGRGGQFMRVSVLGFTIGISTAYDWQYRHPYKLFHKLHR